MDIRLATAHRGKLMIFDSLDLLESDSILGLMVAFAEDPSPDKVDLSVGIYRDASGNTPVMRAVASAEAELIKTQTTKAYIAPAGVEAYCSGIHNLVFGALADGLRERIAWLQTLGGCGAVRVAGEVYARAFPDGAAYISDPGWPNHRGLLQGAGLRIETYPYYSTATHNLQIDAMLEVLRRVPAGSLIVLQASCHNPTGADPDAEQWEAILDAVEERSLLPLFDLAYQGMGQGLDEDVLPVRRAAERLGELMIAVSQSKNFGLYRERTGALLVLGHSPRTSEVLSSQMKSITRGIYSMPAAHGGLIAGHILSNPELHREWLLELNHMRLRISRLRSKFKDALARLRPDLNLDWLAREQGMFSMLGMAPGEVDALREHAHVYMVRDSRINIAGLTDENLGKVAEVVAPLMK